MKREIYTFARNKDKMTATINDISDLALCNIMQRLPLLKQIECNFISRRWSKCALRNTKELVIKIAKDNNNVPCVSVSAAACGECMIFTLPNKNIVRHIINFVNHCQLLEKLTLIVRPSFGERQPSPSSLVLPTIYREIILDCARQLSCVLSERCNLKF